MRPLNGQTVHFFTVWDPQTPERVGEVKLDKLRDALQWTALDEQGVRISDVGTREEAEWLVIESACKPKETVV